MSEKILLWQPFSVVTYSIPDTRQEGKYLHTTQISKGNYSESSEDAWREAQKLLDEAERYVKSNEGYKLGTSGICGICPAGVL